MRTIDGVDDDMRLIVGSGRGDARGRVPCGQCACESASGATDVRLSCSHRWAHIEFLGGPSIEQVGTRAVLSGRTEGAVLKSYQHGFFAIIHPDSEHAVAPAYHIT